MVSLKNKILFIATCLLFLSGIIIKVLYDKNQELGTSLTESIEHISMLEDQAKLSAEAYSIYKKEAEDVREELESYKQKYQYLEEDEAAKAYLDAYIPASVDASIPR